MSEAYRNFALLLLSVESADHLCLKNPQRRLRYERKRAAGAGGVGEWSVVEVNP